MKFLIVESHPYEKSFNRQLTKKIEEVLKEKHEVEIIDLLKDNFNPTMTAADLKVFNKGMSEDKHVSKYQEKIKEADVLVFAFPVWWATMPAILKGFTDKVFLQGFAYDYGENGLIGILNKKAIVISTMEMDKETYVNVLNNPIQNQFINGTLNLCAIETDKYFQIEKINSGTDEYREKVFNEIVEYFKNI